ncbi:MAG: hypothetical protein Q8916_15110, partial [Bacteroidota bacterium]|nr:hypothetical protein [Bacteroidota bacterium]
MAKQIRSVGRGFTQMFGLIFCAFLFLVLLPGADAKGQTRALKQNVLRRIAEKDYRPTFSVIAARLRTGINRKLGLRQLDTMLLSEYGDMFWMSNCAGFYEATKDILPARYKKRIRECWKKFTPYRGDTENHFLMYYGSLYLMSQEWRGLPASEWFMHRSSKELHQESEQYLNYWINRTVRFGQIEFDSPRYLYYFITPLVQIAEYAKDATMKRRCRMMLEFLLADYASQYLNGNFSGAHSRIGNESISDTRSAEATSYGEYFFEDSVQHLFPDIAFAALSTYKVPSIIRSIATDRREPYGVHEIKRSRDVIRYAQSTNPSIYKYTFMTKDYSLGSIQGGLVQPIQQRSWSLTINSSHKDNIIFGLHPYVSEKELGMFFPEEPSFMLEKIDAVKNGYTSENKWVGGSPFETICQWKNQIECDYDIPPTEKYQHVDLFLPGWGEFLSKDARRIRVRYDSCIVDLVVKTN